MEHSQSHDSLMKEAEAHLKTLFENSQQSIYLFLDDSHKICNENFAHLLGYKSPDEWSKVKGSFTQKFVDESSQEKLVSAYQKGMEDLVGSKIEVEWKTASASKVKTEVILTPFFFNDHVFALHFITKL